MPSLFFQKETSGSVGLAAGEAATPSDPEVSIVNVADLYCLVNEVLTERNRGRRLPSPVLFFLYFASTFFSFA